MRILFKKILSFNIKNSSNWKLLFLRYKLGFFLALHKFKKLFSEIHSSQTGVHKLLPYFLLVATMTKTLF